MIGHLEAWLELTPIAGTAREGMYLPIDLCAAQQNGT
jgi:hypothetical protein